ncbi:protein aardvark [Anaeramoeba ignava]|uniref:Protein aardvark n=1 Tax=Anaeramoeba ignava TaxID=1746090 RepID=A0A9Q0LSZ3_ANAIG|nr:protein aardvark [Anaeramoeba ignava]
MELTEKQVIKKLERYNKGKEIITIKDVIKYLKLYPNNEKIQEFGCQALFKLTGSYPRDNFKFREEKGEEIGILGGLPILFQSMKNFKQNQSFLRKAMELFTNISLSSKNKTRIRELQGIQIIIQTMKIFDTDEIIQDKGCWVLLNLSAYEDKNKIQIMELGGIESVIIAMKNFKGIKDIQENGCGFLGNIGIANKKIQIKIRELGGIEVVLSSIQTYHTVEDEHINRNGCWTLFNLCENNIKNQKILGLKGIPTILKSMRSFPNNEIIQSKSIQILGMLSSLDHSFCQTISEANGLSLIETAKTNHPKNEQIQKIGTDVLKFLKSKKSYKVSNKNKKKQEENLDQKNDCLFFGSNESLTFFKNEPEKITKPIQLKFENENEKLLLQISSGYFSTIFLFENGKAIEYLKNSEQNPQKIQIEENIQKVSAGWQNEVILTLERNVFAKGININSKNTKEFINISLLIEDTNDRIIQDIVSGNNSIYLLTSNQNAYGIGDNFYSQLGLNSDLSDKTEKPILMMKNVSKIFSGNSSNHVFLLNSNQELFGCGDNQYGQLGLGESKKMKSKINKLTQIKNIPKGKIIDIQIGHSHSIMLIEDEEQKTKLYSCGDCEYNGLGKEEDTYEFTEIKSCLFENDDDILDFSVGDDHTLILTRKAKLIVFGDNDFGQIITGNTKSQLIPIQIELPKLFFNEDIFNYHVFCGYQKSFIYYSPPPFSNLQEDLLKLFRRKEFYQIEKLEEIISQKSLKESNQIIEIIYSNSLRINPKLYKQFEMIFNLFHPLENTIIELLENQKEIINLNEKIEETMKRIYFNEDEKDFIIERKEKQYKFPKLILIMRSELYRGKFSSVAEDKSNKVTDFLDKLSDKSFQILEYWIYSNQIKDEIEITQEIIDEIKIGIDYFQLNQTNPNLFDLLINKFNNQNRNQN